MKKDKFNKNISLFIFKFKKFLGFSLIELMISLITISCIAAAFAPVITKRLSSQSNSVRSGTQVMGDCKDVSGIVNGDKCSLCYPGECVVCNLQCANTQALNVKKCECVDCCKINSKCENDSSPKVDACNTCKFNVETDPNAENATIPQKCNSCRPGYYLNGNTCTTCPADKCCYDGIKYENCVYDYVQK